MKQNQWVARCSGGAFAAFLAVGHGSAYASEADLQTQIRELAAKIEALQAKQAKEAAQVAQATAAAPAPTTSTEYVKQGSLPGSFTIPGTETSLKIGGFARLDMVKDLNGGGGAFGAIAIPSLVPFSGSAASQHQGYFNMNARQSRLYVQTSTPTSLGKISTYVEGDFIGAGGTETVTNSSGFRLRQAYVEAGPWLAGQTWTNFVDLASYPETVDFAGGNGLVQGIRAPQLRYTAKWGTAHQLTVSVENPESDIFGTVASTNVAASSPTSTTTLDKAPDINARYVYSGAWGRVAAGALMRYLTLNNKGGAPINGFVGESSTRTAGWAVQARLKTFGNDSVQLAASGGPGIARYVLGASANTSAVINNGALEGIHEKAFAVGYQHVYTPTLRSNLVYGQLKAKYPHPAVPLTVPSKVAMLFLNVIWTPVKNGFIGMEIERAEVTNDSIPTPALSNKGFNNRILVSAQYGF